MRDRKSPGYAPRVDTGGYRLPALRRCDVRCSLGLDVRSRALDMARLLEGPEELMAL